MFDTLRISLLSLIIILFEFSMSVCPATSFQPHDILSDSELSCHLVSKSMLPASNKRFQDFLP